MKFLLVRNYFHVKIYQTLLKRRLTLQSARAATSTDYYCLINYGTNKSNGPGKTRLHPSL
jgi:hypothetical protein